MDGHFSFYAGSVRSCVIEVRPKFMSRVREKWNRQWDNEIMEIMGCYTSKIGLTDTAIRHEEWSPTKEKLGFLL